MMHNIGNLGERGNLFDRYEPVQKISEGGFAEVWRAKDRLTNKLVAIKYMKINNIKEKETLMKYFERETQILIDISSTNTPYIPKIIDFRNDGTNFWIVLEYFERTLRQVLTQGTLTEDKALKILKQLAYTFLKINEKLNASYMHRDIKPENILLDKQGNAMLADFGIAKKEEGNNTTLMLGTKNYIAPEVLDRDPNYTSNCDVFSAGLVLYECIFGSPLTIHETKNIKNEFFTRNGKVINKATQNLITEMVKSKNERLNWEQVFKHSAFESIELDPIFTRKIEDKEDIDEIKIVNDTDFKRLIRQHGIFVEKIEKWSQNFPKVLELLESQIKNLKEFALDLTEYDKFEFGIID